MKRITLRLLPICFALALVLGAVMPVLAEETKEDAKADQGSEVLSINGDGDVKVGDTVTYTLYLSDATEPIFGFELRLFYDSDYLEYQKSSLKYEKFDMVIYNEDIKGKLPMNHSSLNNLPSFEEKAQFVSADFKVTKGGEASITYFFTELYGENMEYLKRYKFTYGMTVNGEEVVTDATPPVNADENTLQNNQGDFINYEDGMGEENSPLKPEDHVRVGSIVQNKVVEITRFVESTADGKASKGNFFSSAVFYLIIGVVVVGALVAAIVIVSAKAKKGDNNTFEQKE